MIAAQIVLLAFFAAGFTSAQYGHEGGYGPDGVRNRYFILGHGRPITSSIGHGIYGPSVEGSGAVYRPISSYANGAHGSGRHESLRGHGGSPSEASSYGHSSPTYAPPPSSYGQSALSTSSYGHSSPATSSYSHPAPSSYDHSSPSSYGHSSSYGPPRPAHRSHSAPIQHGYGSHDDLAKPTPYDFGYNVHTDHGEQLTRQETGDGHGNVKGSYGYRDEYGLFRHVEYVADHAGFRANVRTNEPGTAPQDPADVHLQVEHSRSY